MKYFVKEIEEKLMLVSKDIQVGDKVFYETVGVYGTYNGNQSIWIDDEKHTHYPAADLSKTYKIIGEVSPEATWVKEGMEFEEPQVRFIITKWHDYEAGEDVDQITEKEFLKLKDRENKHGCTKVKSLLIQCPTCQNFH